ncbi:MAG: hypothetical protein S4CHLAM2_03770 [Chlamydiales bacterium]|nr:hypothetical protein [Chlamydiales bacterium]
MRSFHLTVYTLIAFFVLVMGCVAAVAFMRHSNSTGLDPAQIGKIRELARR